MAISAKFDEPAKAAILSGGRYFRNVPIMAIAEST
jgi:hypothetical protein